MRRAFHTLITTQGRLKRTPYIIRMVVTQLLFFASLVLLLGIDGYQTANNHAYTGITFAMGIGPALIMVTAGTLFVSTVVRRLHDLNLSGHWAWLTLPIILIPLLLPLCMVILAILPPSTAPNRFTPPM